MTLVILPLYHPPWSLFHRASTRSSTLNGPAGVAAGSVLMSSAVVGAGHMMRTLGSSRGSDMAAASPSEPKKAMPSYLPELYV